MGGSPLKKRKKDGEQDVPATWTVGALGWCYAGAPIRVKGLALSDPRLS
jgi:hypothetical protein